MGQKVTPTGFRLGITSKPQSQWFVDPRSGMMKKIYPPLILEDKFIRDFITQKFPRTAIAKILIYRTLDYIKIEIHTAQAKKLSYQSSGSTFHSTPGSVMGLDPNVNLSQKALATSNPSSNKNNDDSETNNKEKSIGNDLSNDKKTSVNNSSNLKHLQQDLQIELAKYKKTLRMFSNWKQDRYLGKKTNDNYQELPKLWSYETDNNPIHTNNNATNDSQNRNQSVESHSDGSLEMERQGEFTHLNSDEDSSLGKIDRQSLSVEDNYNNDLDFLEQTEKVTQHIGIIVKQLNQPFQYASIFAKYLVSQLERRENSVKQALNRSLKLIQNYNIQGIKIKVSGRLNGVDMAEQQIISKGRIPLSTINANIDYYQDVAQTLYGTLGVKVFIFR